jgi:protein-tyrosine kinase
MEKIQAAIAKARASRAEHVRTSGPDTKDAATAVRTALAGALDAVQVSPLEQEVKTAWAALPSFQPSKTQMNKSHVATFEGGADATSFDALRTKLLQQMRLNNWKRVAITSPTMGCGKSTVALNLAFSLARQPALRTLLIDTDFRRPSLARMCNLTAAQSFSKVLQGEAEFAQTAHRFGDNMAISTNKAAVHRAAEILSGAHTPEALRQIEAQYAPDIMIFDMPPMFVTDDMMAFAAHVDCVLLVAASEQSTIKDIDTAEQELSSQTNVVGVVLNKCRYTEPGLDYSY